VLTHTRFFGYTSNISEGNDSLFVFQAKKPEKQNRVHEVPAVTAGHPCQKNSTISTRCSLLITHSSQLTAHSSQLTAHSSLLTAHCSLLTAHYSTLIAHH
jgi:hypothetical protein